MRYLDALEACCQKLADDAGLGRACDSVRQGLRRYEHGRHVIFFRRTGNGILISRILHERMLPELHEFEDAGIRNGKVEAVGGFATLG